MTPEQLKASIIRSSFCGKLVENNLTVNVKENISNASLNESKKEKKLQPIVDEEIEYEIPENWAWVRIGNVCNIVNGFTPKRDNPEFWTNGDIPWFTVADIHTQGRFINRTEQYITEKAVGSKDSERIVPPNSILICCTASVGEYAYTNIALTTNQQFNALIIKDNYKDILYSMYLYYFSQTLKKTLLNVAGKTTFSFISVAKLSNVLIPIPPLEEQHRIVAKIEELLPFVDRYAEAYEKLEKFNAKFPEDMKKSILQYAIQGKLVEQRPEEGSAEELYKQIQEEKAKLVKEGKIKKEKPLVDITEDEIPFDIPDNWKWVRFAEFGSYKKGPFGSALTKSIFVPKGDNTIKVYEQKNAIQKDATLGEYYITKQYYEESMSGFEVCSGDVIVSCAGTIGETYVMPENIEKGIINQALMRMKLMPSVYKPFFLMFFDVVLKKNAIKSSKGSAIKNIPPFEELKAYLVPLPPLEEQKRIVSKVEELLPYCDQLLK